MARKKKIDKKSSERRKRTIINKRWRPAAALLGFMRRASFGMIAWLLANFCQIPILDEIESKRLKKSQRGGRKPTSVRSLFLSLAAARAKRIRSENELCKHLSEHKDSANVCGFLTSKKGKKSPDNSRYTDLRLVVKTKTLYAILEWLVKKALELGIITGKVLVIDSIPISICEGCRCKERRRCEFLKTGKKAFPKTCLKYVYENAKPGFKRKDEPFLGDKKHCVIDLYSGLTIYSKITPGNVPDNIVGLWLLKRIKKMGIHPDIVLCDAGYYDGKIANYTVTQLEASAIIAYNPGNTKATFFTVINSDGVKIRVTPQGTPLCSAGHKMKYLGWDNMKNRGIWTCPNIFKKSHTENGRCLYNPNHNCVLYTYPKDDPLRFTNPPRETEKWEEVYSRRITGEQTFSHYIMNLGMAITNFRRFRSREFYLLFTDIVALMVAITAHRLRIRSWVRDSGQVATLIRGFLSGIEHVKMFSQNSIQKLIETHGVPFTMGLILVVHWLYGLLPPNGYA